MKNCYYAHCIALYGTPQACRDKATLRSLGFAVFDPSTDEVESRVQAVKARGGDVMEEVFKPFVQHRELDVLAFRALPDGSLPAGVAKEIQWAREAGKLIIELPTLALRSTRTVDETRAYLAEVGAR